MNFFNRIFRSNMVECPRCLGKGKVDMDDIKRLKKEIFWLPGKCAYCNGIGKVPPNRIENVRVDLEYLTTGLPSWERHRVLTKDSYALQRADEHKKFYEKIAADIVHMYFVENKETDQIVDYVIKVVEGMFNSKVEKKEIAHYVQEIIRLKRNK